MVHARECVIQALNQWLKTPRPALIAFRDEPFERYQESDHRLLADLARPSDAMLRRAAQTLLVDQRWRRGPLLPVDIQVQLLQHRGHNQVPLTGQYSRTLRTADRFSSAECHQVRAFR